MKPLKILVLTDHVKHTKENALYALLAAMRKHPYNIELDIATRAHSLNDDFFSSDKHTLIYVSRINDKFNFNNRFNYFSNNLRDENIQNYDAIWLRLPPPLGKDFLYDLKEKAPDGVFINDPIAIWETGSKSFLLNFKSITPPSRHCKSIEDILEFKQNFPIVLKPLRAYGGKGLIKIDGNKIWVENNETKIDSLQHFFQNQKIDFLAVKFLKNVDKGDKRIIVVDGKILGASLRLPANNSWICNVAMNGTSSKTDISEEEIKIIQQIDPILKKKGIVMYGIDTLVNDEGKRVLSEINTTSIGGLPQIASLNQEPLVEKAIDLLIHYILKQKSIKMSNNITNIPIIDNLDISKIPHSKISRYWLNIATDGMGVPIQIPILVAKGKKEGDVIGITAAVHGNELNGIPVIQRLFNEIDIEKLNGTIVGVPVVNVPSFLRKKRRFIDGTDLNHIMPGKKDGNVSEVYAWRVVHKIIKEFDYLIDLHTASNGRINSYYVRADMSDELVRKMALLQKAQIIINNPPNDGTLRGTADAMDIPSITIEIGNPNLFQKGMIGDSLTGVYNLLSHLKILNGTKVEDIQSNTVVCKHSYWIYTDMGGLLTVYPAVTDIVQKGDKIATIRNVFGDIRKEYFAPEDGIVIGKSVSPVNQAGGRILHLGIIKRKKPKKI